MSDTDLRRLLSALNPVLHDDTYVFACVPDGVRAADLDPIATVRETEGVTVVVTEEVARANGLDILFRAAWITLNVVSDLEAVGLTAAFSTALARGGIACNVIAGAFHDHIFVPFEQAPKAIQVLESLKS